MTADPLRLQYCRCGCGSRLRCCRCGCGSVEGDCVGGIPFPERTWPREARIELNRLRQHLADWLTIYEGGECSAEPGNANGTGIHTLHGWAWKTAQIVRAAREEHRFLERDGDIPAEYSDEGHP